MRRKDNRGVSFVMVIVAMAIVAVLAVTVLWIALVNLQMKVTDEKNTDNFYSAEGVLDQICTGLQGDISKAYSAGYTDVMQNYSGNNEESNEAKRQSTFTNTYIKTLKQQLQADSTGMTYNLGKLKGYVDSNILYDPENTSDNPDKRPCAIVTSTSAASGEQNGLLNTYTNRTVIKGIRIEYTDEKGYKSIIETDISLAVPSMSFTASGGVPELFTYSLIGNDGLQITDGVTSVNLSGNLYAGSDYAVGSGNGTTSITIPDNATMKVTDSSYLIAEGDVEVGKHDHITASTTNNSKLIVDSQCQLWTDNINVNGATLSLEGTTYVSDDMTLRGTGSSVKLGKDENNRTTNGKYIGFGNDQASASDSSAIIINGRNSSLDMAGLKELMLAGTAYINTSAIVNSSNVGTANSNVAMGESISVKGDQIAYLVPPECIGTDGNAADSKSVYNKNPLSYSEYNDVTGTGSDKNVYTEINANVVSSKTGKALSEYIPSGAKIEDYIKKVFVPSSTGSQSDGLVYYYINLPTKEASEYYQDYYNTDSTKLQKYTQFYTDNIQVSDDASIYTAGNYSIYDGTNLSLLKGIADDSIDLDAESASIKQTYEALNSKLITNYGDLPANATTVSLFTNIINSTNMTDIISAGSGGEKTFEAEYQGTKYTAVVKNGDYTFDTAAKNKKVDVIVATGNVYIDDDFTGTIVAKGKIIVKRNCKITNGTQEIFKALLLSTVSDATDSKHLYDVFMDGAEYLGNVSRVSDKTQEDTKIDYSSLITYQNWTKK